MKAQTASESNPLPTGQAADGDGGNSSKDIYVLSSKRGLRWMASFFQTSAHFVLLPCIKFL